MIKIFLIFFLFYFIFKKAVCEKIICNNLTNIHLEENKIVFIESPNFPNAMNETNKKLCKLQIYGNSDKENMKLIFVITNGHITGAEISDGEKTAFFNDTHSQVTFFNTSKSSMNFSFVSTEIKLWEGFQGFVTYEVDTEANCFLADKNSSYIFTNESEILYLRSSYLDFTNYWPIIKKECAWRFLAPDGYGFKVDVLSITGKVVAVSNHSRTFITQKLPYYYFNDNKLLVGYTTAVSHAILQNTYFSARVSIVSPKKNTTEEPCIFRNNGRNKAIWKTNFVGYSNNGNCLKTFSIPPNHQLYANVSMFEMENDVDTLRFYSDKELLYPFEIDEVRVYVFPPKEKNVARNLTLEFLSDGSIINKGFIIEFESVECKCGEPQIIIPCHGERNFTIMENDKFLYCADLSCNFSITINESCHNNYASLQTYFEFANPDHDNFQILSDFNAVLNVTGNRMEMFRKMSQTALILPNRTTTLIFQSSSKMALDKIGPQARPVNVTIYVGQFRILAKSIPAPIILPKVIINDEKLLHEIKINEMPVNSIQTIELSKELIEKNDSLDLIYGTPNIEHMIQCITLYKNESMMSIQILNVFNTTHSFDSTLTIYKHIHCDKEIGEIMVKAKKMHSFNCRFHNNVINIADIMKLNHVLSMVSSPTNPCQITLLDNIGQYAIKKLWTNSKENNVSVFYTANKLKSIFEFNFYTASQWKTITLNAISYTIIIPPHSSLMIEFYFPVHGIQFSKPLLSHYDTPFYSTPNIKPMTHNTTYEIGDNLIATFTLFCIHVSPHGFLKLIYENGKTIDLKSGIDQSVNATGIVTLFYYEPDLGFKGAMVDIKVQIIDPTKNIKISNKLIKGWDGLQNVSIDGFKCLEKNNFSFYIARVYRSIGIPDLVGIQNIKNARDAGWKYVDGSIVPCLRIGCPNPKYQIEAAVNRVKAEGAEVDMYWLSIMQNEWYLDVNYNQLYVLEFLKQAEAMGIKIGIFTTRDNWDILVKVDWNGAADKPLLDARSDDKTIYEGLIPFGGWKSAALYQYKVYDGISPCGLEKNYKIPVIV